MARKTKKNTDEDIVEEAHKEFSACEDRERHNMRSWLVDLKFANGDPDNGWQWDEKMRTARESDARPCLTINKTKQHNRQITNDARQNKPSIKVSPVDDGADKETADVLNGIIRHIESNSSADTAYDIASEFAVDAGLGYWRVTTDYAADNTFDQEIFIKACPNPLNVYLGRHSEADGSDAKTGFIFEDLSKEEFESRYPDAELTGWENNSDSTWMSDKTIRVAEYFKIVSSDDVLCAMPDGPVLLSTFKDPEIVKAIKAADDIKKRTVSVKKCKWYLIAGEQLLEKRDWLGKYIPIVRVVGEEVDVDGKVYRKGHTRSMKDAQRMYNYNSSAAIEYGALQTKTPITAAAEAIEGYEEFYEHANKKNLAYMPFNAYTEDGRPVPQPNRMMPPAPAQLFLQGMATASEEMKMASGQYDASMGAKSNETSGRAIMARQHEGDTATFHFIDNVARAIKYTGKILVDLIPKIYDTERVVRILGEDGTEDKVRIDPNQPQASVENKAHERAEIERIYNPSVGRYDVTVSVGPSFGSRRQEAFQALTEMSSRNPQLMQVAGDLIMRAADFPMAEEMADRLKKTLPPGMADDAEDGKPQVPPEVQQHIDEAEKHVAMLEESLKEIGEKYNQLHEKSEHDRETRMISAYAATTERIKMIMPHLGPEQIAQLADNIGIDIASEPDINAAIIHDDQPPPTGGNPV